MKGIATSEFGDKMLVGVHLLGHINGKVGETDFQETTNLSTKKHISFSGSRSSYVLLTKLVQWMGSQTCTLYNFYHFFVCLFFFFLIILFYLLS